MTIGRAISTLAAALLATAVSQPAAAAEGTAKIFFGALAVGTITPLEEGHVFWSGHFSGATYELEGEGLFHNAFVQCPGTNDLNFAAGTAVLAGYCVVSDGTDSKLHITWSCTGTPGNCVDGAGEWAMGTGKWEGITAIATFTANLGPSLSDGTTPSFAIWDVTYQTPE